MLESPDKQISLPDPDARSMATNARTIGIVGYNVQTAVAAEHHLIVAREVTNSGTDRRQLAKMAKKAQAVIEDEGDPIRNMVLHRAACTVLAAFDSPVFRGYTGLNNANAGIVYALVADGAPGFIHTFDPGCNNGLRHTAGVAF